MKKRFFNKKTIFITLKTWLPDDVVLTSEETLQVFKLEQNLHNPDDVDHMLSNMAIHLSTNIGVHYFCIENAIGLTKLAFNRDLSHDVVSLLFEKSNHSNFDKTESYSIKFFLFNNSALYNNDALFKKYFYKTLENSNEQTLFNYYHLIFAGPINLVMLLLTELGQPIDSETKRLCMGAIDSRKDEILAWVKENNPELAELPLLWVLKAYEPKTLINEN